MRKVILLILLLLILSVRVEATDFAAPEVPDSGAGFMPDETETFAEGIWFVIKSAINTLSPSIKQASGLCMAVIGIALLTSIVQNLTSRAQKLADLVTAVGIGVLLLQPASTLINLGTSTVEEISEYGKVLIPVMTSAMAAQGGVSASTALYSGTILFSSILTNAVVNLVIPLIYVFLCLCIANSALGEDLLKKLRDLIKWLITWSLKIVLYIFTGYISITGVVSGSADASMVRATKLAISGSVPVVGNILSDASETILVSVSVLKNAAGVYGILAIVSTWIGPFLKIGVQYLLLKLTAAVCGVFASKRISNLVQDFSAAMGFVIAAVSTISLLLMISVVCFMKGVS